MMNGDISIRNWILALSAWAIESDDKVVFRSMNGYTAQKKIRGTV